jgi:hypothetical protein
VVGHGGELLRDPALAVADEIEGGERGVDDGVAALEQGEEVPHRRRVEVEVGGALRREVEPGQRAGIGLRRDEEVEQHLVDVLDFVVPLVHRLLSPHEGRNVPAHPEAPAVGISRGFPHQVLGKRVVDLDLGIAVLGVPVHRLPGSLQVVDHEPAAGGHRALTLDEPGGHHPGEHQLAGGLPTHQALEGRIVVAHVAHAGDPGGEVEPALPGADVYMHVEQARQQHPVAGVEHLVDAAGGRAGGQHRAHSAPIEIDIGWRPERGVLAVEHPRVLHQGGPGERVGQPPLHGDERLVLGPLLPCLQRGHVWLPALLDHLERAGDDEGEEARAGAGGEPGEGGRVAQAGDRDQPHRLPRRPAGDRRLGEPAHGERAGREQRELSIGAGGHRRD